MIVTLGEPMMVFNGPPDAPLTLGAPATATFAGAESNVAIALARLGHPVRLLTALGDDPFGHAILKTLRGESVDVAAVRTDPDRPTGVMFKTHRPGGEPDVSYYRSTSAFAAAGPDTFDPALWRDASLIYLTGITPALSPTCRELVRHVVIDAAARHIPVWLDPNYRAKLWSPSACRHALNLLMPRIHTVLPSLPEGELLTGKTTPGEIACALMGKGANNVVVKAGAERAIAYTADNATADVPAFPIPRVVDPIGAGDAFAAGYLSAHLDRQPPADALRRAHALAAHVCQTRGDWEGLPTRAQLDRFLSARDTAGR
jgi:2-dehydro-3-deoxygluconokinase